MPKGSWCYTLATLTHAMRLQIGEACTQGHLAHRPAGDMDPFVKIHRPDGKNDELGLKVAYAQLVMCA